MCVSSLSTFLSMFAVSSSPRSVSGHSELFRPSTRDSSLRMGRPTVALAAITCTRPFVSLAIAAASIAAGFSCLLKDLSVRDFFTFKSRSTSSITNQRVLLSKLFPSGLLVGGAGIFLSPNRLKDMDLALPTNILGL